MASRELSLSGSFTALGGRARARGADVTEAIRFVGSCARAMATFPRNAIRLGRRSLLTQIRFTAVDAMPIIAGLALLIGALVIAQAHAQAVRFGASEALGQLLATVIVRELGPLFAAIIVVARSGTAIASELATARVMGEVTALEALGVDPIQYMVLPRVFGSAISVALLAVYFDAIAIGGGMVVTSWLAHLPPADYLESLRLGMSTVDIVLVVIKGALFGLGTAGVCCWAGLRRFHRASRAALSSPSCTCSPSPRSSPSRTRYGRRSRAQCRPGRSVGDPLESADQLSGASWLPAPVADEIVALRGTLSTLPGILRAQYRERDRAGQDSGRSGAQ
jgi:phospholipid/cholesterol/gamma-HCH transport system permease protein